MSQQANIEDAFPLSPLQQGMLFHSLGAPDSGVYVTQVCCAARGVLHAGVFFQAWQRVLDRHQALRAAFAWEGMDQPLQVIGRRVRLPFRQCDLRGLDAARQRAHLEAYATDDRARGFRLSRAPLMRVLLARLDDERHEIVWTYHHIVCDGWSRPLLLAEFWSCYAAFVQGREAALPAPRPYADYIARLPRESAADEAFWREQLAGLTHATPLGVDRAAGGGGVAHAGYGQRALRLSEERTAALEAWSRRQGLSLGTLFTAAWALALRRYSRQDELLFGVTVSGRSAALAGIDSVVGLCINTLPLRLRVAPSRPLLDWLREVQARAAELREHEHTPLARLRRWSALAPGQPLFESIVVFENFPVDADVGPRGAAGGGLAIDDVRGFDKTNFPLTLIAAPSREFLLMATYDPARFSAATVDALLGHLATLLEGFTLAGQDATVDQVGLTGVAEREQIVTAWNATARVWPEAEATPTLAGWLEAQAARTPDAVALEWQGGSWTYAELHARANRIARRLRRLGVGPEARVGVWIERSPLMVAALLGALKAGCAYVPLDPRYPAARLAFQAADAQVSVLLASRAVAEGLPDGAWALEVLDAPEAAWLDEPDTPAPLAIHPDQLAYVIYTSGSTGRPKGAMNTQRGVLNRLLWAQATYALSPADRVLQKTSSSFDVSVWELFWPLGTGARLVLARPGGQADPAYLAEVVREAGVTVMHFVPSLLEAFVAAGGLASCARVRLIVCSGEGLPGPLTARCAAAWSGRLENLYGPTEAAVDVTFQACTAESAEDAVVPIGRPVANTQVYVCDHVGQPAPVGVAGELLLGGVQVGRGYWARPELTAERYVPDPFGAPGGRLYRSGDLARYRPDGVIEYLGRLDQQVKLHGNRIELEEIEAALRRQPGIRDAAVVLREDEPGARRLVGYVVGGAGALEGEPLRRALRDQLPDYMVPAVLVPLDELPLSPNGKLDRRALPAPSGERPALAQGYVAPRTAVEAALAEIWAEVLRLERVGIHDNFFALGGDSMRTIQVQAGARERQLSVSLEQLMRRQTIAELAEQLEPEPAVSAPPVAAFDLLAAGDRARLPDGVEDAYPLTELQAGMLFHSELDPRAALYHDVLGFHVRAPWDQAALSAALAEVMAAHEILRASIHVTGYGEPLQLIHREVAVPLHVHDLRAAADPERVLAEWLDQEQRARFDWKTAPLFRFHVHLRGDDSLQCTLVCHHAILDGWSVATFFTELFGAYLARVERGQAARLERPRTAFREHVALERAALQDPRAREYWTQHLADGEPSVVPRWPLPGPVEPGLSTRQTLLRSDTMAGLTRAAQLAGVPLKSVLLAGHLRVLSFLTNERDVVSGVVVHGRAGTAEAERVLGLYLNTPPLRCRVEDGSWVDLARRVFDVECGHARYRHFPMPTLQRTLGRQQLFDAAFNFTHFHVFRALQDVPRLEVLGGGSRIETNFPLLVQCALQGAANELELRLEADRAQFPEEQVERLLGYYVRAYEAIAADPHGSCTRTLVSPDEREAVLARWNATEQPHRLERTLVDLVEEQVRRVPQAVAVIDAAGQASYAEFWARAEALACALRDLGVGPDDCVGLCLPRSLDACVAILGTLRAGAAYVPLDPAYPDERLAFMLADASARVLLTTRELGARLAGAAARQLCLDELPEAFWRAPAPEAAAMLPRASGNHLAYVMYTSGSTGRPKGIALPHRCLTNLIEWHLRTLGGGARTLQFASLGFDASFHEMAAAWCSGGALYLVPDELRADPQALARALRDQAVEKAVLPPVVLQQVAEHCGRQLELFASLRQLITTGEQLRLTRPILELLAALPRCTLHNHYGPAETHVVTAHELTGTPGAWPLHPPVGVPIDNTQIYVLDAQLEPRPLGTPGELYIGGVSLARGYLARPDLSAERFVPDPFAREPGGRLYRTGDLARLRPDGALEFLGRLATRQVKLRGFRIELGEVEAVLARHPDVRDAVVLVRDFGPDDRRLAAYVVPQEGAAPAAGELRAFAARSLPEFMLPAAFVLMPELPLTTNGKVDRRRLPDPLAAARSDAADAYVAPRSEAERVVTDVYAEVLRLERVGVLDDFFERGGHSLLATQAVVRLRETFGVELPLRALFERRSAAGLVLVLAELLGGRTTLEEIAGAVLEVGALSDAEVEARLSAEARPHAEQEPLVARAAGEEA